ncbi:acyltransferase [Rhodococcus maanshanensis]|nr:acyltransferase [Rhodococcus maanshanensis]MCZ4555527.1 acyltransferase [Rhodococcus maanshanensis]
MSTEASHPQQVVSAPRGFIPALEGMRGFAALGVLVTHVAFQTGATGDPVLGRIWGRFDMAVALFFALSGFLLWRPHAVAARGLGSTPPVGRYLMHRAARILPAYWVAVVLILLFLPEAGGGLQVWLANLGLAQVFVPLTLTGGLTQMWSLSVEVAFYALLPLIALAFVGLRGATARLRVPVLLGAAALSLGWVFVPVPTPEAIHSDNWLPGYLPWFAAGMVLAELALQVDGPVHRLARRRVPMAAIAVAAFALSCTDLAGPEGLTRAEPWQYSVKIALGAVLAFALLAPLVLGDTEKHRILASPLSLTIGRWSYGLFIWHLAVLSIIFPVFGIVPFSGSFVFVLVVTTCLSLAVASASYALVEEPTRLAVKNWERRRNARAARAEEASGNAASPTATTAISAGS